MKNKIVALKAREIEVICGGFKGSIIVPGIIFFVVGRQETVKKRMVWLSLKVLLLSVFMGREAYELCKKIYRGTVTETTED